MTRAYLETIARHWLSLWCSPVDWALFDALRADDFEDCSPARRCPGQDSFRAALAGLLAAFPDLETRVDELAVDEAACRVTVRWSGVCIEQALPSDVGSTRPRTVVAGVETLEIRDGQVIRRWGDWEAGALG